MFTITKQLLLPIYEEFRHILIDYAKRFKKKDS